MQLPRTLLNASSKKLKKSTPKKVLIFQETETLKKFLIFQKMKLTNSDTVKFLIFSQKKAFLIFPKTETPKKIPYISGNENFEKILFISGGTSKAPKTKISNITPKKIMNKFF